MTNSFVNKKWLAFTVVIFFAGIFLFSQYTHAATGSIVSGYEQSTFMDQDINSDGFDDVINWNTTNGTAVSITDSALTGYIFGETVGWINLAPTNSGVTNTTSGVLGGYAWGENTGWINFAPTQGGVTIDTSTGYFSGHAWSQNYGWILFDCPGTDTVADADSYADTCVKTDWTPTVVVPPPGGGPPPIFFPPPPIPTDCITLGTCPVDPGPDTTPDPTPDPTPDTTPDTTPDPTPDTTPDTTPDPTPDTTPDPTPGPGGTSGGGGGGGVVGIYNYIRETGVPIAKEAFIKFAKPLQDFFTVKSETAVKVISVTGLTAMAFSIPLSFWRTLLALFGYRKRRPWGTVYDSITKAPLDPAHVVLMDANGNIIATSLTDMDGRYGFSVNPGTYTLVANKTDYTFPSTRLTGHTFDEVYSDLYFGGTITIEQKNEVILKSIPLDPINTGLSWNEQYKKEKNMNQFFKSHSLLLARISLLVFAIGFIVSLMAFIGTSTLLNGIVLAVYVLLFIARQIVVHIAPEGGVVNKETGEPIGFAVLTITRPETGQVITKKVVDASGHYYAIIQNGQYNVSVDKKNEDGTYTTLHTESITIKHGLLSKVFEV